MQRFKHHWYKLPRKARRPLVFVIGMLLILISGLIGWLPGPGGMVPFLLGIAVLASEFAWAERLRDKILRSFEKVGRYLREDPVRRGGYLLIFLAGFWLLVYFFFKIFL